MKNTDLALQVNKIVYNVRVAIVLEYNETYIFEKSSSDYYVLPGGRVKYNENLEAAIIREVHEELGIKIQHPKLVAVCENHFNEGNNFQEHCFIFYKKLHGNEKLGGDIEHVLFSQEDMDRETIQPTYIPDFIKTGFKQLQLLTKKDVELHKDETDLCFQIGYDSEGRLYEMNVRATAIIRTNEGILVDTICEKYNHLVCIGGRMQAGELSSEAIKREVDEEISATISKMTFCGIGEDFFDYDTPNIKKHIHFISFIYEVKIEDETLLPTKEVVFDCYPLEKIIATPMNLASTKAFLLDKNVDTAVSVDRVIRSKQ